MNFKNGILPISYEDRLRYLYRLQELLRLEHNRKGQEYRDGKIDMKNFRHFQNNWFEERSLLICKEINKCRENILDFKEAKLVSSEEHGKVGMLYKLSSKDKTILASIEDMVK